MSNTIQVYSTTNLSIFRDIDGNRNLDERHVRELMISMQFRGFDPNFPCKVNENMEIIDGQHRIEAARRLQELDYKVTVYYYKVPGATLADCIRSNELQKNWENPDYVEAYAVDDTCENHDDYMTLHELYETYKDTVSLSILCKIAMDQRNLDAKKAIRSGNFHLVREYDTIVWICDYLKEIKEFMSSAQHRTMYTFAVIWAIMNKEIDDKALKYQIKKYAAKHLEHATNFDEALRQLSKLYHYNDRRAKKLTPTKNFYTIYDEEQSALREERRRQKRQMQESAKKNATTTVKTIPAATVTSTKTPLPAMAEAKPSTKPAEQTDKLLDTRSLFVQAKGNKSADDKPYDFSKIPG